MTFIQTVMFCLILGCNSPNSKKLGEVSEYIIQASVNDTILFGELIIEKADSSVKNYYLLNGEPYTGQALEYELANDGKWSFVYSFKKGIMQRLDVYGISGYQHRFVEMRNGYDYHTVMFHRNGNQYIEEFYDRNKKPIGIWKRWSESGELEWEKFYE